MAEQELRARQREAAEKVGIPPYYGPARRAADIARGGPPILDGVDVNYWYSVIVPYVYRHGDATQKERARAYARKYLGCEYRGCDGQDFRKSGSVWSLNHQLVRQSGVYFSVQILGEAEARRYGDPGKTPRAKQMILDVLTGASWYGADGSKIPDRQPSAGDHPEPYRSRHYAPRCLMYMMALAELAEPDVAAVAMRELDKWYAHMRPGVRPDGTWDEAKLPHYRADTCTRCPCQRGCDDNCPDTCIDRVRAAGLTCHPGETQVIGFIFVPGTSFNTEFSGGDGPCRKRSGDEQWMDGPRFLTAWRPLR